MDNADRTCPERFEIPPEVLPTLQRAADAYLEWANDNDGRWNNEHRAKVLSAARLYDVFHNGAPNATQVAFLADWALRKGVEWPEEMPTSVAQTRSAYELVDRLRELVVIRDAALADRPMLDDAPVEASAPARDVRSER